MMNSYIKPIVLTSFVALSAAGIGAAIAQVPNFSIPALPGSAPAPANPTSPVVPTPTVSTAPTPASPSASTDSAQQASSNVKVSGVTEVPTAPAKAAATATPPLPNESADKTGAPKSATPTKTAEEEPNLNELPVLPLPQPAAPAAPMMSSDASVPLLQPVSAPVQPKPVEKTNPKTWLTKLAPAIIPPKLGYNYRRETLPNMVYRTQYDAYNKHLPVAVTREDYQRLFLLSVARNDVTATRALLHEGVSVNQLNANGESALALAQRYHADDTARLLLAWGAQ